MKTEDFNNALDIEEQFQFYLKKVGINNLTIAEGQMGEMRKLFVAGMAQMFALLIVDINALSDEEGAECMQEVQDNLNEFWRKRMIKHNPNIN